jgi:methyl-accepting chemotaxis protein
MTQMDDVTQQNTAMVEEATSASEAMRDQSAKLQELIAFFDIGYAGKQQDYQTKSYKGMSKPQPIPREAPSSNISRQKIDNDDNWVDF